MQEITHQRKLNPSTSSTHPTERGERVQSESASGASYLQVDANIRVKLKSLAKCILVSIGHRFVGLPFV
jgi:hypothetical protein